jgi:hypothetical protein
MIIYLIVHAPRSPSPLAEVTVLLPDRFSRIISLKIFRFKTKQQTFFSLKKEKKWPNVVSNFSFRFQIGLFCIFLFNVYPFTPHTSFLGVLTQ